MILYLSFGNRYAKASPLTELPVMEGTIMTLVMTPGSSDGTVNLSALTTRIGVSSDMPPADNLTTTTAITPYPMYDPLANRLAVVQQGIKGARFLMVVMATLLGVFTLATLPELTLVMFGFIGLAGFMLGAGLWTSCFSYEEKLAPARAVRRLTVYFAVLGTTFTILAPVFHALMWWKTTGQVMP